MTDEALVAEYALRLGLLVRKSFLSHGHIAMVLEDMLRSDMVILWELMGGPVQAEPFEELLGDFMDVVQRRADADVHVRDEVREAIRRQLQRVEGRLHLH